nr:MAG TPA: hypothetical protein [Caudoviricetes sp.]
MDILHSNIKNFNELLTKEEIVKRYREDNFKNTLCFLLRKETNENERK